MTCNQDCNQGRNCQCVQTIKRTSDRQMAWLYFWMCGLILLMFVSLRSVIDKPTSAEDYADKLCQELYGPQVGHKWVDGSLMCETARGEIVQIKVK